MSLTKSTTILLLRVGPAMGEIRCDPYGKYGCWSPAFSTSGVVGFCIPVNADKAVNFAQNMFQDFYFAAAVIGIMGFLASCALSFAFLAAVRVPLVLRFTVWTCIILILLICLVGSAFMLSEAHKESKSGPSPTSDTGVQIKLMIALGALLASFGFLWLCLTIYFAKKINVAIDMIRQTSKAILDMPILVFSPILNACVIALFTVIWMIYCVALATSGEILPITETTLTGTYTYDAPQVSNLTKKSLIFVCFMWLW